MAESSSLSHLLHPDRTMCTSSAALRPFVERLLRHSVLSDTEQAAILDLPFTEVSCRANEDIVRLCHRTDYCCFVADGLIASFGQDRNGERQITALHILGDMPDLHSVIRPAGIGGLTTLTPSVILQIPHAEVRRRVSDYPAIAEAFWRDCLVDAAVLMDWIANIGRRSARARLAHIFCEMSVRYARDHGHLDVFQFPVTQQRLGEIVALTGIHVNRTLRTLRQEKLVTFIRGEVVIPNWTGLVRAGEFDPAYLT